MTSKEKLHYLTNLLFRKLEDTDIDLTQEECDNVVNFNKDIRKDLDKLERIKAIIGDYGEYKSKPHKPYNRMLPAAEDYIRQIKEVLK